MATLSPSWLRPSHVISFRSAPPEEVASQFRLPSSGTPASSNRC